MPNHRVGARACAQTLCRRHAALLLLLLPLQRCCCCCCWWYVFCVRLRVLPICVLNNHIVTTCIRELHTHVCACSTWIA